MQSLESSAPDAPLPVAEPVGSANLAGVADALAAAAAALAAAANALRGGSCAVPQVLPLPPAQGQSLSTNSVLDSPSVRDVVNEFLIAKARAGRSDRYLRQLRVSLASFTTGRAWLPLASVTVSDVEAWLFARDWQPKTMRGYLTDLRTLYGFALRRGYVRDVSPCSVELPEVVTTAAPGIHSPEQVRAVLDYARGVNLDVMRHLAVRYFAGVRSAEVHRMREDALLLDRGYVEVHAHKAKTRRRRLVKIQPALAAWLALGGTLRPMSEHTVRDVVKGSGVPWLHNVTRHSFVSYHLAMWENAARTALEAGHAEQVLFNNYRAVVSNEQARAFWSLFPR